MSMQRWIIAVATLFSGAVSVSRADYVIVRFILNNHQQGANQLGVPPMTNMGIPPMGGFTGQPIGGGFGGGSFQGTGGFLGRPGASGFPGPMGAGGVPGPVGGFGGQPGPGPGPGVPGPMGAPMGNQGQSQPPVKLDPEDYVTAVVELKGAKFKREVVPGAGYMNFLYHKWGKSAIYEDRNEFQWGYLPASKLLTPLEVYARERKAALASRRGIEHLLDLAEMCLQVGLPDKCMEVMEEIEAAAGKSDSKKLPERVAKALAAYRSVKPILKEDLPKSAKAKNWSEKLGYRSTKPSKHYVLVNNSDDDVRDGVQRRLDALEHTFKTFYLLFAIKGKALPAPSEKLVAILVDNVETFNKHRRTFNVGDLVSDGYYARQENLAVFSPNRIDAPSRNFEQVMREVYRKNGTELLTGKFPDLGTKKAEKQGKAAEVARAQSLALIEQALREESEVAAATHEGAAQLIAETGVLPRTTNAPKWLRFGLASIFEMPKGPFPGKSDTLIKQAFYPGAGGPNWAWARYLHEMMYYDKVISPVPSQEVLDTLEDVYFDRAAVLAKQVKEARDAKETKEPAKGLNPTGPGAGTPFGPGSGKPFGPGPGGMPMGPGPGMPNPMGGPTVPQGPQESDVQTALARAHTMSWAVTFYLFTDRFEEFQSFLAELARLPRDAEIDHFAFYSALAKAFGLQFEGLTPMHSSPKPETLNFFAKDWLASMRKHEAPSIHLKLEEPEPQTDPKTGPGNPMGPPGSPMAPPGPGNPMGFPGR